MLTLTSTSTPFPFLLPSTTTTPLLHSTLSSSATTGRRKMSADSTASLSAQVNKLNINNDATVGLLHISLHLTLLTRPPPVGPTHVNTTNNIIFTHQKNNRDQAFGTSCCRRRPPCPTQFQIQPSQHRNAWKTGRYVQTSGCLGISNSCWKCWGKGRG